MTQAQGERQGSVIIEQATHLDPALGGLDQCLDQRIGTGTGLDQVKFQVHLLLGADNGREHARKECRPVDQQLEAIAGPPRKHRAGQCQRAVKISTAPTGTDKLMAFTSASLRSVASPGSRSKSSACNTSGSRVTT
ncbi:hypothetical protein D3C85_1520780 [compost metagenome]